MTYQEYIHYHLQGDAGVEERMIASLCQHYALNEWDAFRLIYYYTMTYHIPSALSMLLDGERDMKRLKFRTDRRYVRCNGAYQRLLEELNQDKFRRLCACKTTTEAYKEVRSWFFFGRYAAYLFLEVFIHVFPVGKIWLDDLIPDWEPNENYTKGAISLALSNEPNALNKFLNQVRNDTGDNVFSIETSLCAVAKFSKGTRWNGFYTERMLNEAIASEYAGIIYNLVR